MHKWVGLVQNKLRILTLALEKIENLSFRPLPKLFNGCDENAKVILIGLKYKPKPKSQNNENGEVTTNEEQKDSAQNGLIASSKLKPGKLIFPLKK